MKNSAFFAGGQASGQWRDVRLSLQISFLKLSTFQGVNKANPKRLHTVRSHLYNIPEMTKLWNGEQVLGGGEGGGMAVSIKGMHKECW